VQADFCVCDEDDKQGRLKKHCLRPLHRTLLSGNPLLSVTRRQPYTMSSAYRRHNIRSAHLPPSDCSHCSCDHSILSLRQSEKNG